jgi:hypothetical protein
MNASLPRRRQARGDARHRATVTLVTAAQASA